MRRLRVGHRPNFDRLESRLALSTSTSSPILDGTSSTVASPLSIVSTSLSPVLTSPPKTIYVTFDRPLNTDLVTGGDFEIVQVNADGSTSPLGDKEGLLGESPGSSDTTIALTTPAPLLDGEYELLLLGTNGLLGADGSTTAPTGSNTVVSDFAIKSPTAPPTELGTLGPTLTSSPGDLDLGDHPGAVDRYTLTLAPGHRWRLGLEITPGVDGSNPPLSLSLFDSKGRLISTDSLGVSSALNDPYLFAGLEPGVYSVGVSAQGNRPDDSGNYGTGQSVLQKNPQGGRFTLDAVADVADQPTQVLGLRLDHADPLSNGATGLTLQFSGSIQSALLANASSPAVTLVDMDGKSWPLTPSNYDATLGQLSFVFDQSLPAGDYTLELANNGGLVDLDGDAPVAPGLAAGVLGTFGLSPSIRPPGDLGPILPTAGELGLPSTYYVGPGSSSSKEFLVEEPGIYTIAGVSPTSGLLMTVTDPQGHVSSVNPTDSQAGVAALYLKDGLYTLTITNPGSTTVQVPVTVAQKDIVYSQFLQSAVAQGSAFSLRLVTPEANFGVSTTSSSTTADPTTPGVAPSSSPATSGGSGPGDSSGSGARGDGTGATVAIGLGTPNSPSVAGLLYSLAPVGRPSAQSNQISVVGPATPSGSMALASNNPGLPPGLIAIPVAIDPGDREVTEAIPVAPEFQVDGAAMLGGANLDVGLLARSPGSRMADDRTLVDADWIGRLVSGAFGWSGTPSTDTSGTPIETSEAPMVASGDGGESGLEEPRVEVATFSSPIAVGVVVTTLAYHYRSKRLGRPREREAGPSTNSEARMPLAGPHRRRGVKVKFGPR